MSKGDAVEVMVGTPNGSQTFALVASKAGRIVRQAVRSRSKVQWLDVEEMTRTAKVTGNKMSFRLAGVLAVRETTSDVPDEKPKPKARPRVLTPASIAAAGAEFEALGRTEPREAVPEPLGLTE